MQPETNRIEYKRQLTDKFERSVVAFLNYPGGGEILVGVDNDGSTAGLPDADAAQLAIVDRIKNNIRPATLGLFDVAHEQRDGKDILRVVVSAGQQRPYYLRARGMTEDGCYIRAGSSTQSMTERMIETLLSKRHPPSLQTMRSPRQKLTFRQLRIYYEEMGLPTNKEFLRTLELLDDDGSYNYAAYLLADENAVSIKVAKYAGPDKHDLVENEEYGNRCLLTATHRVLERLETENRTYARIAYPTRIEKTQVDKTALREAIINAIVHNDYSMAVPLVEIYSDRITVTSAGGLVNGLTRKDFFNCRSMLRNRILMRVFRDVELVESLGSGMTRILNAYDRSIFDLTPSFLVVTFPLEPEQKDQTARKKAGQKSKNEPINEPVNEPEKNTLEQFGNKQVTTKNTHTDEPVNEPANEPINIMVKLLLAAVRANPGISKEVLAHEIGKSRATVTRMLKSLVERGKLKRIGPDKGGHWKAMDK